jgi:hypothetical protein
MTRGVFFDVKNGRLIFYLLLSEPEGIKINNTAKINSDNIKKLPAKRHNFM